jgi:hypothetical protein
MASSERAIYYRSSYGPTFGVHDLFVASDFDSNANSYTSLGTSFANDTGIHGQQFLTAQLKFTVKEIEVFEIDS